MSKAIVVGDKVEAGVEGTESYDVGNVLEVDGDKAFVGWESGTRTWLELSELRSV